MPTDSISSTTQQFLDIYDITNNFVIMKDGTVSVIITVDAMNFGLLAEEEQDAVMYAYAGLLNSLNYPVQIVINSQTKDVTSYLQLLKDQESSASNETIRKRIKQYREFVTNLIHDRNVLDKKFYVVIPANSIELGFSGAKSVLPGQSKFDISTIERSLLLEKAQNVLDPRRDHLIAQFARIGLYSRQLTTQEIIQLFYIRYNPEAAEGQQIGESSSYSSPLVQASIQGNVMNADTPVATPTVGGSPEMPPMAPAMPAATPEVSAVQTPIAPAMPEVSAPPVAPVTPAVEATPAMPASPAATTPEMTPVPPVAPPVMPSSIDSMPSPVMSAPTGAQSMESSAPMTTSPDAINTMTASTSAPAEADVQAGLDQAVRDLGGASTETPSTTTPAATIETPAASMTPPTENPAAAPADLSAVGSDLTPPQDPNVTPTQLPEI